MALMMKKKPPPGATLIARLKERRMQRDASMLEEDAIASEEIIEAEAGEIIEPVATELMHVSVGAAYPSAPLIQREISIGDLRPTTQNYAALTDEIRLAGRFAAVGLIAQGLRLTLIREAEIHKEYYGNFEDYCRSEHNMSATYAYRLIRMAEMAEKMAEEKARFGKGTDPFEAMLHLGHRHLMALLPLPQEKAEEFLVSGIPLISEDNKAEERVPITAATEKQIKAAFKHVVSKEEKALPKSSKDAFSKLQKLVAVMENYAEQLEAGVNFENDHELNELVKRFNLVAGRIQDGLKDRKP